MSLFSKAPKKATTEAAGEEPPVRKTRARAAAKPSPDLLSDAAGGNQDTTPTPAVDAAETPPVESEPAAAVGSELVVPGAEAAQEAPTTQTPAAPELAAGAPSEDAAPSSSPAPAVTGKEPRAKKPKKTAEQRREAERQHGRQVAKLQRQRSKELLKEFVPNQRGAVMVLQTRLGSTTVEGWFKRKFVLATRQMYRIRRFPLTNISPDVIQRLEREILNAISATEARLSKEIAAFDQMIAKSGSQLAQYHKFYELDIAVSTKGAMGLHAVYQKADELHRRVETADLLGLLDDSNRKKAISKLHGAVFGLVETIDRFHQGLFVRVEQALPDAAEIDSTEAAASGKPVDHDDDAPAAASVPGPPAANQPQPAFAAAD